MTVKLWTLLAASVVSAGLCAAASAADRHTVILGSGEVTGYYFPAAGALCRVFNKEHPKGMSCAVTPSSGSAANVAALKAGEVDFALLQSRAAQLAGIGLDAFKESGPFPELRAVMSLHGESVLVLARPGSGIENLTDLKGKRVNLGRPGSFQRSMAELVLEAAGLSEGDLSPAVELDLAEEATELCEGNIDAAFFTGVHPMAEANTAIDECNAQPIAIKGKNLDGFLKRNAWLSRASIRRGTYEEPKDDLPSLQLRAVLVTSTRVPADDVYDMLKAVHANFPALTRLHPVLKGLVKAETAKDGIAIKLHDGADKFYGEAALK